MCWIDVPGAGFGLGHALQNDLRWDSMLHHLRLESTPKIAIDETKGGIVVMHGFAEPYQLRRQSEHDETQCIVLRGHKFGFLTQQPHSRVEAVALPSQTLDCGNFVRSYRRMSAARLD